MGHNTSTTLNNNQTSNDADGIVTMTVVGGTNDIVVLGFEINNATATSTVTDNGVVGNPWTRLNSPNPDVLSSNTDVSLWAKKLQAGDVGKTVTIDAGAGGVRLPVAMSSFSGRSTVADIAVTRMSDTSTTTADPADITVTGTGWDIVEIFFTRAATAAKTTMTGVPTNHAKRAEAGTDFSASPNMTVTITSRDNVGPGTFGTGSATFSQSVAQVIEYTLALKTGTVPNVPPTANAGADQTNVEPGQVINLNGTDNDTDGTISSRAWTVSPSGAAVFVTGQTSASATARVRATSAGETITFTYTVTDNSGDSTPDTMTVQVREASDYIMIGGSWVPTYWEKM